MPALTSAAAGSHARPTLPFPLPFDTFPLFSAPDGVNIRAQIHDPFSPESFFRDARGRGAPAIVGVGCVRAVGRRGSLGHNQQSLMEEA